MKRILVFLFALVLLVNLMGCSDRDAAGMLTAEEAENIALAHAGLTRSEITQLHAQYDVERGVPVYEVEFTHNGREYDYHISAENGQIVYWE